MSCQADATYTISGVMRVHEWSVAEAVIVAVVEESVKEGLEDVAEINKLGAKL